MKSNAHKMSYGHYFLLVMQMKKEMINLNSLAETFEIYVSCQHYKVLLYVEKFNLR